MNGFKAKKKIPEGVEKCIARGIRCYAAMPKNTCDIIKIPKFPWFTKKFGCEKT